MYQHLGPLIKLPNFLKQRNMDFRGLNMKILKKPTPKTKESSCFRRKWRKQLEFEMYTRCPPSNLDFILIDLHHVRESSVVLSRRLLAKRTAFLLIQEPWYYETKVGGLINKSGSVIFYGSVKTSRAALYIREDIKFVHLPRISSRGW